MSIRHFTFYTWFIVILATQSMPLMVRAEAGVGGGVVGGGAAVVGAAGCPFGDFEVDLPLIGNKGTQICKFISDNKGAPITKFMAVIINAMTAVVILAGLFSLVIGAYLYMTAGGEANRVDMAKGFIKTALIAIVLALTAYLILNTISPQFTPTQDPNLNING